MLTRKMGRNEMNRFVAFASSSEQELMQHKYVDYKIQMKNSNVQDAYFVIVTTTKSDVYFFLDI